MMRANSQMYAFGALFIIGSFITEGESVESAYAYIRNYTPYSLVLHAFQITAYGDKVQQEWFLAPAATLPSGKVEPSVQTLGRVDTLAHMRIAGQPTHDAAVTDMLRTPVDIPLPAEQKGQQLLISIFMHDDRLYPEVLYVSDVNVASGGISGYHINT